MKLGGKNVILKSKSTVGKNDQKFCHFFRIFKIWKNAKNIFMPTHDKKISPIMSKIRWFFFRLWNLAPKICNFEFSRKNLKCFFSKIRELEKWIWILMPKIHTILIKIHKKDTLDFRAKNAIFEILWLNKNQTFFSIFAQCAMYGSSRPPIMYSSRFLLRGLQRPWLQLNFRFCDADRLA